ncbi:hypothetical protein PNEG_01568 [Pneumocystis murina B123]|uniref:Uncharacterized protein n=1 Tax=Pneumocystis murina (strain B123) TaxID=1069680 RepID=M7P906_PNEMU|nr:hypothetical protein PNEG_01568 [Pneumocystis murina B123]EMR10309.1 hypothetical protein PNEG_01568 [Pneumocystis murina B123]
MGKTQSKSSGDVVFQNESRFPLQFSNALVNHLDSKVESDATRAASLEEHIQERVAVEIERLHSRERDILIEIEKELIRKNAKREKAQEKLNSFSLKNEMSKLEENIKGLFQIRMMDEKLLKKKGEVIDCLKENEQKPLNCDETIKAFRKEVDLLKDEFINKYQ